MLITKVQLLSINICINYQLSMNYDDMHRILAKRQEITQNGIAADGVLNVGYQLGYSYSAESPFRLDTVTDANYRTVSEPSSGDYSDRHSYTYDRNGNLTGAFTDRAALGLGKSRRASERLLAWDEENRLTAVCDNGYVSAYLYDAARGRHRVAVRAVRRAFPRHGSRRQNIRAIIRILRQLQIVGIKLFYNFAICCKPYYTRN